MSWYISGWHRQQIGPVKKLIAYTPANLDGGNFWSVAVVAPEEEVKGLIGSLQFEQWLLTGLAVLVVVGGFGAAVYFAIQWSALLAVEVDNKTAALRASEAELRAERDKVKESYDQLVEAQGRLIRSERLAAIGEAAAKVCHEIKNPLMVIGGFARQLLRQAPYEGKVRDKLEIIAGEVERLESMMIEVGDFTKPTKLNRRLVDLNELAVQVQGMMVEELAAREIEIAATTDSSVPAVSCDPEKIKQVLLNLVKNAAEAMPEGGAITLAQRREPGWAALDVTDTGKGVPPEHLEAIFTPFFTTKKGGSGLGLSVCHKIIQDHGGRIEVRSEPQRGSTFSILLPLTA
jgi:signal transduction histidine kinase